MFQGGRLLVVVERLGYERMRNDKKREKQSGTKKMSLAPVRMLYVMYTQVKGRDTDKAKKRSTLIIVWKSRPYVVTLPHPPLLRHFFFRASVIFFFLCSLTDRVA